MHLKTIEVSYFDREFSSALILTDEQTFIGLVLFFTACSARFFFIEFSINTKLLIGFNVSWFGLVLFAIPFDFIQLMGRDVTGVNCPRELEMIAEILT